MIEHRIRELREARNLTQAELGSMVQKTKDQISRLEKGETKLDLTTAKKLAQAFDVPLTEVVKIDGIQPSAHKMPARPHGFNEDVSDYKPSPNDPLAAAQHADVYLKLVENEVLDKVGATKGCVLEINISRQAVKNVQPLDLVLVRYHPADDFMRAVSLVRQFVPPRLLITNSIASNMRMIDMDEEDAHIVGVVAKIHPRRDDA